MFLVVLFFYLLPLKWVGSHTGLGCLMGGVLGYSLTNVSCYLWELFRGLFLWPFGDNGGWTDIGMQMVMITYALLGIGSILIYLIIKNFKEKSRT